MKKIIDDNFPSGKWKKTLTIMRVCIVVLLCSVGSLAAMPTFSQETKLDVSYQKETLGSVLNDLKKRTGYQIVYFEHVVPINQSVTLKMSDAGIDEILTALLTPHHLTFMIEGEIITITKKPGQTRPDPDEVLIKGRVIDDGKEPMVGVTVIIAGTTRGVITNANGEFTIRATLRDQLEFSFIGYQRVLHPVNKDDNDILIIMKQDNVAVDEVVVTGRGVTQRREAQVGSVSTIATRNLKVSSSDLTTAFAGVVPGMIAWQTGGLPGALTEEEMNTQFYIRGITSFQSNANTDPLILLDGVEISKLDLARINADDIESFSVLKDASATAMYGARGANGVIYVVMKKGQAGSVYTSFSYEVVATEPTREIEVVNAVDYMKLYNEASTGRYPNITPKYTREQIQNTGNPDYPYYVYPANDWYDILFKKMSVSHRGNLSISGGSDIVQYRASVGYNVDNGMLKTDRLNQFKVNINNQTFSLNTNITIDLKKGIKLQLSSVSTYDKYHGPIGNVSQAYSLAFNAAPTDFAVIYPADDYYSWEHIRFGGRPDAGGVNNPYAYIQKGYTDRMRYSTINNVQYIQSLSWITSGLEFRGNASFRQNGYFSSSFSTDPYYYTLASYDFATGKHSLTPEQEGNRKLSSVGNNSSTAQTQLGFDLRLQHAAAWGDHQTFALIMYNNQETRAGNPGNLFQSVPQRNMGLSGQVSYGYKDRYFFEGSFGYNGSERFADQHKMGFFPSLGGSWVISKENFMQPLSNIVDFLKIRMSWGKVGNDGIINEPRFVHLTTIYEKEIRNALRPSYDTPGGQYLYMVDNYANESITWEISEQYNLGIDMWLFNRKIELTADLYQAYRHNVLDRRTTIPTSMGLPAAPLDNVGKTKSQGIDLAFKYQHAFSHDFYAIVNGTFTYSKAVYQNLEESANKAPWQRRNGKNISQAIGYIAEGLFQDQEEIRNSPTQGGNVMPGDIRYHDVNKDGKIDIDDAVPIGLPQTPRIIYGLQAFFSFKSWEFSLKFQGLGGRSFFIDPAEISPFYNNKAVLKKIADSHWSETKQSDKSFWPRLSTNNIIVHNPEENRNANSSETYYSTYFMRNGAFLRCQSIELAYSLPKKLMEKARLNNIKMYVRTNNPFVISAFNVWDIELGSNGFNYPIQRTYSLGVNVSF